MDPMVLKYVGLATVVYGLHVILALAQLLLGVYLVANGALLLQGCENLSKRAQWFGLVVGRELSANKGFNLAMIATGVAFLLPVLGLTHWLVVIACPVALFFIVRLAGNSVAEEASKVGRIMRGALVVGAVMVCGFTVWEEQDLVKAGAVIAYKAYYWNDLEVATWQQENDPYAPKIGDMAPDFELTGLSDDDKLRLSDYRGVKPIVLLFGSFT